MQQVAALRESQQDGLIATAIADSGGPASEPKSQVVFIAPAPVAIREERLPTPAARTVVHTYLPVRNDQNEVIDFRLSFDRVLASEASLSFIGAQVVQCGPSVAPGEIFHTLKRVLESGEAQETVTRHVHGDQELCFYQTACRCGDAVTATTSIVSIR